MIIQINEKLTLHEMYYINENIESTLQKLRSHYHNDGTLKVMLIFLLLLQVISKT